MAEYIEREALIAAYDAAHKGEPGGARKLIADAPAADVAPVVHGRWIPVSNTGIGATGRCTVCNKAIYGFVAYKYCPNCGARMDGE
jgi:rubrerythrin